MAVTLANDANGHAPVAYVPLTLTNSQGTGTGTNFVQAVQLNSSTWKWLSSTNLSNINFQDGSGNIIPSWLLNGESWTSTSTGYFVKLASGIAANSSVTIYLVFYAIGAWSKDLTTGAEPNYTSVYGQFDSGANVFPVYGGGGPNGWSQFTTLGGTWTTTTGGPAQQTSSSGSIYNGTCIYATTPNYAANGSYIIDAAFEWTSSSVSASRLGIIANGTVSGGAMYAYRFCGTNQYNQETWFSFLNDNVAWVYGHGITSEAYNTPLLQEVVDAAGTWSGTLYSGYTGAGGTLETASPGAYTSANYQGATSGKVGFSMADSNGNNTPGVLQWFLVRSYPPNGVMPTVSAGAVVYVATPSVVQSKGAMVAASATSVSVTLSSAPSQGNLLVAFLFAMVTVGSWSPDSGWTQAGSLGYGNVDSGNQLSLFPEYKVLGASPGSTYTFTLPGGGPSNYPAGVVLYEITGQDANVPIFGASVMSGCAAQNPGQPGHTGLLGGDCSGYLGLACGFAFTAGGTPLNGMDSGSTGDWVQDVSLSNGSYYGGVMTGHAFASGQGGLEAEFDYTAVNSSNLGNSTCLLLIGSSFTAKPLYRQVSQVGVFEPSPSSSLTTSVVYPTASLAGTTDLALTGVVCGSSTTGITGSGAAAIGGARSSSGSNPVTAAAMYWSGQQQQAYSFTVPATSTIQYGGFITLMEMWGQVDLSKVNAYNTVAPTGPASNAVNAYREPAFECDVLTFIVDFTLNQGVTSGRNNTETNTSAAWIPVANPRNGSNYGEIAVWASLQTQASSFPYSTVTYSPINGSNLQSAQQQVYMQGGRLVPKRSHNASQVARATAAVR